MKSILNIITNNQSNQTQSFCLINKTKYSIFINFNHNVRYSLCH